MSPDGRAASQQRLRALEARTDVARAYLHGCFLRLARSYTPPPPRSQLEDVCSPEERLFLMRLRACDGAIDAAVAHAADLLAAWKEDRDAPDAPQAPEKAQAPLRVHLHAALNALYDASDVVLGWKDLPVAEDGHHLCARLAIAKDSLPMLARLSEGLEGPLLSREAAQKANTQDAHR